MNSQATYQLPSFTGVLSHDWSRFNLMRDRDELNCEEVSELDVKVRSGDYFITAASTLDMLSQKITDHAARLVIEDMVSDLIHLQENYRIIKKQK